MSNLLDNIYLRGDGTPRNFVPPEFEREMDPEEVRKLFLEADSHAFKRTQRNLALGIIAVGGAAANLLNPPDGAMDVAKNFGPLVFMQALNYASFRKGLGLMKERLREDVKSKG